MQVDVTTVIAVVGGLLSTALGIYVALLRYTVEKRDKEIDHRLTHCDIENSRLTDRVNTEEKATIRQDGEIKLVKQVQDDTKGDMEEIKRTMVTKAEWEPRMTNLERTANQILAELRGRTYSSGSAMHAVSPPGSPMKR